MLKSVASMVASRVSKRFLVTTVSPPTLPFKIREPILEGSDHAEPEASNRLIVPTRLPCAPASLICTSKPINRSFCGVSKKEIAVSTTYPMVSPFSSNNGFVADAKRAASPWSLEVLFL